MSKIEMESKLKYYSDVDCIWKSPGNNFERKSVVFIGLWRGCV
jgi:hypothetical protein